jgi:hypothetical protein
MNLDVLASPNTVEKRVEMVDARPATVDMGADDLAAAAAGLNFLEFFCGRRHTFRAPTAVTLLQLLLPQSSTAIPGPS